MSTVVVIMKTDHEIGQQDHEIGQPVQQETIVFENIIVIINIQHN